MKMLKLVFLSNLCIGSLIALVIQFSLGSYGLIWMFGLLLACISYTSNGLLSQFIILRPKFILVVAYILSYLIRILTVSLIGYAIFNYNQYDATAYILGYTSSLIGICAYSYIDNKISEGK